MLFTHHWCSHDVNDSIPGFTTSERQANKRQPEVTAATEFTTSHLHMLQLSLLSSVPALSREMFHKMSVLALSTHQMCSLSMSVKRGTSLFQFAGGLDYSIYGRISTKFSADAGLVTRDKQLKQFRYSGDLNTNPEDFKMHWKLVTIYDIVSIHVMFALSECFLLFSMSTITIMHISTSIVTIFK